MNLRNLILLLAASSLVACGTVSRAPQLVQHDLGGSFKAAAQTALPLRNLSVSGSSLVSGPGMSYREVIRPTTRGTYAFNRWAAAPASLVDQALSRLLPLEGAGSCVLGFQLADFLLEVDQQGRGEALLAGTLSLSPDGRTPSLRKLVDIRVPVAEPGPQGFALGERRAVEQLAGLAAAWVRSQHADACRRPG